MAKKSSLRPRDLVKFFSPTTQYPRGLSYKKAYAKFKAKNPNKPFVSKPAYEGLKRTFYGEAVPTSRQERVNRKLKGKKFIIRRRLRCYRDLVIPFE